mmetsp:Transcript_31304/g.93442  ORF Transcript_31304/g.93442 Transcript_31304/m.93442 type:complete len:352 (+) Transcript_31304:1988-3043(+)
MCMALRWKRRWRTSARTASQSLRPMTPSQASSHRAAWTTAWTSTSSTRRSSRRTASHASTPRARWAPARTTLLAVRPACRLSTRLTRPSTQTSLLRARNALSASTLRASLRPRIGNACDARHSAGMPRQHATSASTLEQSTRVPASMAPRAAGSSSRFWASAWTFPRCRRRWPTRTASRSMAAWACLARARSARRRPSCTTRFLASPTAASASTSRPALSSWRAFWKAPLAQRERATRRATTLPMRMDCAVRGGGDTSQRGQRCVVERQWLLCCEEEPTKPQQPGLLRAVQQISVLCVRHAWGGVGLALRHDLGVCLPVMPSNRRDCCMLHAPHRSEWCVCLVVRLAFRPD